MLDKIAMIIPSRGRPDKAIEALKSVLANSTGVCQPVLAIDDDEAHLYCAYPLDEFTARLLSKVPVEINPRLRMNGTLNLAATKYSEHYKYIGFMGDDHRVRTPNWDAMMIGAIKRGGHVGITYGDDGHQGPNIPTAVVMSSNIIQTLGYMSPPDLVHLFLDNTWKVWGERLNCLHYLPNVSIEHMHPHAGKGDMDAQYVEVNSSEMMQKDKNTFELYCQTQLEADLNKLRTLQ